MAKSQVTSKGQTTIPKEIREYLDVQAGDMVEYVIEEGQVVIRAATMDIMDLKGFLKSESIGPVSLREMKQAVRKKAQGRLK